MSSRTIQLTDDLHDYLLSSSLREEAILTELRTETVRLAESNMQISPEQGQFMAMLARLMNARRYLEVGTFTGYSMLKLMLAMPSDASAVACDTSEEWTRVARRYWERAGLAQRIDLRLAPALKTLEALQKEGRRFDLAFIDADKENYAAYYEACLTVMEPGALILIDNTLWGGSVIDPAASDVDTVAIRKLNRALQSDDRVDLSMVPIGDGLTLARKR